MSTSSMIACKSPDFGVIKDLGKSCDTAYLETLNIFSHIWQYRGEGNANVVVALQDELRVIRLSKVNVGEPLWDLKRHRRKVEREVIFANRVFGPLIGPEFVGSVKAILLSPEQILRLNGILQNVRPIYRLHKEIRVPYATSHSDFARIHRYPSSHADFCVEIKPKQGWWRNTMNSCNGVLSNLCTYCLNQFLKLKRSKISSRTSYCPLDLFSGNPQRMIEAVTSLIANPQNNFRIFCDGKLVYGDCKDESLETVLNKWLGSNDKASSIHNSEMPSSLNSFIYLLCVSLLKPKNTCGKYSGSDSFSLIKRQLRKILCHTPPSHLYANILSKSPQSQNSSGLDPLGKENLGESCSDEATSLPEGSILSRILEIQKLAERPKIHGVKGDPSIYSIYRKICPVHCQSRIPTGQILPLSEKRGNNAPMLNVVLAGDSYDDLVDATELERFSDAESLEECSSDVSTEEEDDTITESAYGVTQESPLEALDCPSASCLSAEKWLDEIEDIPLSDAEMLATELYLLAATAKDCSIMVTFSPTNNNESGESSSYKDTDLIIEDLSKKTHRVRIGVADLDPKPVTTIVRHYLRDNEMMQAYDNYCNSC